MLGHAYRTANYKRQTNSKRLTPAQNRRARKKMGHFLAKRGVVNVRVSGK